MCCLQLFPANTAHMAQYKDTMVAYMIYYLIAYKFLGHHCALIYKTSFRPMPTSWRSLTLGHDSSTGHSLPGARPLDPLVHIFNPSSGTHVLSQFQYTSFIPIIKVTPLPCTFFILIFICRCKLL